MSPLFEEIRSDPEEAVTRLERLVELSATLNSTLNLNDLLSIIINTAADILACEATSILLYDEKGKRLFFAAATGEDTEKLKKISVPLYESLAGTVFRMNKPLILNDLKGDPRHNSEASETVGFQSRSLAAVPLRIREKTIGVLEALNKKAGPFTENDKDTLSVVASHAAIAIHNAQLVQALEQAYDDVSKADELKSNFLALASHELRTPLGIIIGYATFLREESEGESSGHAAHVLSAALKMRSILDDMNNLTMLESEVSSLISKKASLQKILERVVEEIQELAQAKNQSILFDFPKEPLMMMVDEKKLNAAVTNLLHNAIRFSAEKGEIVIGIKAEKNQIFCWVEDKGIGIAKDKLANIFEKFYQVESPNTRHYGGMGIGLTIAQGLIEAQGGKLWAESEGVGKGAIFKILLPLREAIT